MHSSVLRPDREGTTVRYRILVTIRLYGLDRLPDTTTIQLRHRDYFLRFAEEVEREWPSEASCGKALVHWFRGEYEQAKLDLHAGLLVARQFRDVMKAAMLCELMAWVRAANGEAVRAAEVFGIADRMWPLVGGNPMLGSPLWIQRHEACVTVTKEALGAERFAAKFDRGAATARDFDSATKALLGEPEEVKPARPPLTERERQVANLVAEGLTNREIATNLAISQRTVAAHVDHVLTKLGFTSRTQIATWVVGRR